ncbi:hypothetical protein HFD88_009054 [Aspergillus terreus]|nr:hypothetical protein HFD88_009054 [Aspergillus terreus]
MGILYSKTGAGDAPDFQNAEGYMHTILECYHGIRNLYPLEGDEKIEKEVMPVFQKLYRVIAHTTVDPKTEHLILNDARIKKITPHLRRIFSDCECVFEEVWAAKVIAASSVEEGNRALHSLPLLYLYDFLIAMEWNAARTVLRQCPQKIAILGSGPLPLTAIRIRELVQQEGQAVSFHLVERYSSRVRQSEQVLEKLGLADRTTHRIADAADQFDLREYDAVYFAALVGSTRGEKESLLLGVVSRMRKGAILITRSTYSLKQLAYPAIEPTSLRLKERLHPILTVHGYGKPQGSVSASVIISQVSRSSKPFPQPATGYTQPFWRTEPHKLDTFQSTPQLPESTDILIIGGGYVGASIAYHLLKGDANAEPPSTVLLEAREACSGATGRNGLNTKLYLMSRYAERYGMDAADEVVRFELAHLDAIKDLVQEEAIDCELTFTRSFDVYLDQDELGRAKDFYDSLVRRGMEIMKDVIFHPHTEIEEKTNVRGALGGFSFPAGQLWPYKLVMRLLEIAASRGLNLQTNTLVTDITQHPPHNGGWRVTTSRGTIHARRVILATNAFTSALAPEYARAIVPCKGICCHVAAPSSETLRQLPGTYCIRLRPGAVVYLIDRGQGSIIVGGAQHTFKAAREQWYNNPDDASLIQKAEGFFDGFMQRTFLDWQDIHSSIKHIWTGVMGYSADSLPHVGEIPGKPGQFIAAGFNGHGMPVGFLVGDGFATTL